MEGPGKFSAVKRISILLENLTYLLLWISVSPIGEKQKQYTMRTWMQEAYLERYEYKVKAEGMKVIGLRPPPECYLLNFLFII